MKTGLWRTTVVFFATALLLSFAATTARGQSWRRASAGSNIPGETLQRLAVSDLNGDGAGDIVAAADHRVQVYIGNGKGSFILKKQAFPADYVQDFAVGYFSGSGSPDILALVVNPATSVVNLEVYSSDGTGAFKAPTAISADSLPQVDSTCSIQGGSFVKRTIPLGDFVLYCTSNSSVAFVGLNSAGHFSVSQLSASTNPKEAARLYIGDVLGKGRDGIEFYEPSRAKTFPEAQAIYFDDSLGVNVASVPFAGAELGKLVRYDGEQYASIVGMNNGSLFAQHGNESGFEAPISIANVESDVLDIAFGNIQSISHDRAFDIVLASRKKTGFINLDIYINTARTQVQIQETDQEQSDVNLNIKVLTSPSNIPLESDTQQKLPTTPVSGGSLTVCIDGKETAQAEASELGEDVTATLAPGTHKVAATYKGSGDYASSANAVSIAVAQPQPAASAETSTVAGPMLSATADMIRPVAMAVTLPASCIINTIGETALLAIRAMVDLPQAER